MLITKKQLYTYLANCGQECATYAEYFDEAIEDTTTDEALFNALKACDIRCITADAYMSEHKMGGDDLVTIVDQALAVQSEGYKIITWYGDDAEVLIVGIKPDQITFEDHPVIKDDTEDDKGTWNIMITEKFRGAASETQKPE